MRTEEKSIRRRYLGRGWRRSRERGSEEELIRRMETEERQVMTWMIILQEREDRS